VGKKRDSAHVGDCLASCNRRASTHTFHNKNCNSGLITGREEKSASDCWIKDRARGLMCGVHHGIRVAAIIKFPLSCLISAAIQVALHIANFYISQGCQLYRYEVTLRL